MPYCKAEGKTANKLRKCSGHPDTTQSFQGPEPWSFAVTFSLLRYTPPPILAFWPVHTVPQAMEDKEAAGKMGRRSRGERGGARWVAERQESERWAELKIGKGRV